MKPRLSTRHETAMTLFEVGVVVAVLLILLAVLLPTLLQNPRSRKAPKINCMNNLKQIGLGYRIWEGDNGNIYPMGVSVTNGGSFEMVTTGNVIQSFLVMSNELSTPKILYCPADADRAWVASFSGISNSNISYLVGADTTNELNPQMILSGDCNFEIAGKPVRPGLLPLRTNAPVAWDSNRHIHSGNLGLGDGSVQSTTSSGMRNYFVATGSATNRLAIP
jgi:type II secretory pathway pseudopilin PulG